MAIGTLTWLLVALILVGTAWSAIVEGLNLSRLRPEVPPEFADAYDSERYRKSQEYLRASTRADLLRAKVFALFLVGFILAGGFETVDRFARDAGGDSSLRTGLVFVGLLGLASWVLSLPFRIHHTFVLEARFGFNRTTPRVFVIDQLKAITLGVLIGAPLFAGVQWFFENAGPLAWLWSWVALTFVSLLMTFIAPVVLLPLFNKFEPLPAGELRSAIEEYARSQSFKLAGIFSMDGSKRSSKANAFFTGFGRFRRIVLFDTLIKAHPIDELVAVLAHEIGHYRRRHIPRQMVLGFLSSGAMFFLLSLFIGRPEILDAFRMSESSVYAGLVLFSIAYSPISRLTSLFSLHLSRKYEYEADEFSVSTYVRPRALASALKRLSVENLSNLKPHPLKVFMDYTHPPILERLKALERS